MNFVWRFGLLIICLLLQTACSDSITQQDSMVMPSNSPRISEQGMPGQKIRFLALGDSYTIGEGVDAQETWPAQLASRLRQIGVAETDLQIVARTGWTTGDLLTAIESSAPQGEFDLVTLLIGVNNQYRGYNVESYRQEFRQLLQIALGYAANQPGRILVMSIPDWGVTPFAKGRDRSLISRQIDQFNLVNRVESQQASVAYLDITPISREAAQDISLLVQDGLHPSPKMYAAWVDLAFPLVLTALGN